MYIPMVLAIRLEDWPVARTLFYYTTFFLILLLLVAIAVTGDDTSRKTTRDSLVTVFGAFTVMPALLAMPFNYLVPEITWFQAYFEMLSSLTTTGATLFDNPAALPAPLHLMRALAAWFGGFFMLVVAISIFAPLQIGGFEIFDMTGSPSRATTRIRAADAGQRLRRSVRRIFPVYLLITAILAFGLMLAGDRMLVAVIHAMSVLSTSGISPVGGLSGTASGYLGETLVFCFFVCALSHHIFTSRRPNTIITRARQDREISLALIFAGVVALLLFLRHVLAAPGDGPAGVLTMLWGGLFTVLSFLTTTGFESVAWGGVHGWPDPGSRGLVLMGLAVMGGGIATTAGGIKLMRVYALCKHGQGEISRLRYPSSVIGQGMRGRMIRREATRVTWVFFMLFLMSLAVIALALGATGMNFADALVFAIAALSNTGPLAGAAGTGFSDYASVSDTAKAVLCAAMILGRLESLAVIALFNPDYRH
ncbi:MAG: TrkH family potassium uptake protein [Rhodobacteraceae bacterium]|nr:TrkH family potassium uptake protein [Paracoccaceae bacterium]